MIGIRAIVGLLMAVIAPMVFAYPGHPTFGPVHSHGATELGAVALILVVVVAVGARAVHRRPRRLRDRLTRFRRG
ncbi:MAG TPA: hypothetical protein VGA88_05135 [Burkholderiales bacterium]